MLQLFGRDQALVNIARIIKTRQPEARLENAEDLRQGLLAFLAERQSQHVLEHGTEELFIDDPADEAILTEAFRKGSLNDLNQDDLIGERYDGSERLSKLALARGALEDLLLLDDDLCLVFGVAIHSIFVRPSKPAGEMLGSHGGSSSAAIGSIWLTVGDQITQRDLMEMYVHELAHHLLFLDELNHPQFDYEAIALEENFARSAVLKKLRPLDKVVHSIVVATEILLARERFLPSHEPTLIHPRTDELATDALASIASVRSLTNYEDLVAAPLRSVVERCHEVCDQVASVA